MKRERLSDLALEAAMVVFAVLVAFGVDEWREQRQLRSLAEQAQAAVLAEVAANLEELRDTGPSLRTTVEQMEPVIREADIERLDARFSVQLPEVSRAAWDAAQLSRGAPYFDYAWLIRVARAYETYEAYERMGDRLIDAISGVVGGQPRIENLSVVYGYLLVLTEVHGQVEDGFAALLTAEAGG